MTISDVPSTGFILERSQRLRRPLRIAVMVLACAGVIGAAVLSITPPPAVTRRLLTASSYRLLPDSPISSIRRFYFLYVEFAVAGKMARFVEAQHLKDDVARIDFALKRVQLRTLTPEQVPHAPHHWPVLVAGFGFCDQVNAGVAQVLAHSFRSAQIYALYDPKAKTSPHTVGRVWSDQWHDWLYFDAFTDPPMVYRHLLGGGIEILNHAQANHRGRRQPPLEAYALDGWTLNEYSSSFGLYVSKKIASSILGRETVPPGPLDVIAASPPPPPENVTPLSPSPLPPPRNPAVYRRVAKAYIDARASDLFGDVQQAKRQYLAIAGDREAGQDDLAAVLQNAARFFATAR